MWTYHLMPFFMLFMNIIIASTLSLDLSTFLAFKNDRIYKKIMTVHITDLPIKWNIPLDFFFHVLYKYNNCSNATNSNLGTFWALQNDEFSIRAWLITHFLQNSTMFS